MSDLTGGKGRTARNRQIVSNFGVLEKVQSNLSNKSGTKILEGGGNKFTFTAVDFHRTVKIEKYKLDKLLGKESNKSAVFLTSKGQHNVTNPFIIGQNSKDKSIIGQRCGRNGRGNSPQPQIELLRKGGFGSYTSSTLQTVSMINTHSQSKAKWTSPSVEQLCQAKISGYEWQGEVLNVVQFEEAYDPPLFLSQSMTPETEEATEMIEKILKGYPIVETSESKFFLPKASMISVEGCSAIDICHERVNINLDLNEVEKKESSARSRNNEIPEEFNYGEPGYALGLLDTPSFTGPCKSDDFTFGRGESKEEGQGQTKQPTESMFSSMNYEADKLEVFSELGHNTKEFSSKERKINTQRDYGQNSALNPLEVGLPLSERQGTSHESKLETFFHIAVPDRSNFQSHGFHINGFESIAARDLSFTKGIQDYQDSAEDSERYNLYKNIYVSDSEDCDYEVPRSDILSESGNSSHKGKIYGRFDEGNDVESSQLFLDEELRSKYQSLLQNN
jgi:hypothetical protein